MSHHLVILKKPYLEMIRIEKKDWRAWVVLGKGKDFGLLDKTRV